MEIRHPVEGYFGSEFPAICNHFGVMAAWSRNSWKKCPLLAFILEKRPFTGNFSKFYSERIHRDTDQRVMFKFRDIAWPEIGIVVHCLSDKKFAWLSRCRYCTERTQNLPVSAPERTVYPERSRFHPNRFTVGGVIAERVNTVEMRHKLFPIFGEA